MSTTPRSDQAESDIIGCGKCYDFARTLERELSTITAERDQLRDELDAAKEKLRTEAVDDYSSIKELQRELAAERARLKAQRDNLLKPMREHSASPTSPHERRIKT
jgi:predicted  nucleic acid-binding Zn-ribbon protein